MPKRKVYRGEDPQEVAAVIRATRHVLSRHWVDGDIDVYRGEITRLEPTKLHYEIVGDIMYFTMCDYDEKKQKEVEAAEATEKAKQADVTQEGETTAGEPSRKKVKRSKKKDPLAYGRVGPEGELSRAQKAENDAFAEVQKVITQAWNEKEMRENRALIQERHGQTGLTPDMYFYSAELVNVCGHHIRWIEYKRYFGFSSEDSAQVTVREKAKRYRDTFGPGMLVFARGYEAGFLQMKGVYCVREDELREFLRRLGEAQKAGRDMLEVEEDDWEEREDYGEESEDHEDLWDGLTEYQWERYCDEMEVLHSADFS